VKLCAHGEDAEFHELLNYSLNVRNETVRTLLQRGMRLSAVGECA
jgi:hypothetical protein